jgi:two-component system cell cycle sensor histidine kinase/response regulator CckA
VYGTVKQLNGYIDLTSDVGRGTTFTIHIPVTVQPMSIAPIVTTPGTHVGNETILLVEDEPGVRAFVSKALRRFGYHVIEAESGEAALQAISSDESHFDLLMTDVVLPGIDGVELATLLRQRHPNLPVLCMSGYSEKFVQTTTSEARLPFLEKPFSPQTLLNTVRQLLG